MIDASRRPLRERCGSFAALRGQANRLDDDIAALTDPLNATPGAPTADARGQAAGETDFEPGPVFQLLRQVFEAEREAGTMTPERKDTLDQIMGELGHMVARSGTTRSLTEMAQDRQTLQELYDMSPIIVLRKESDWSLMSCGRTMSPVS